MKYIKTALKLLLAVFFALLILVVIGYAVVIPAVNDSTAHGVEKSLLELPLPEKTELVESCSAAGKLEGNGNGMQYFGAILIKTELSTEELEAHYSSYRDKEWECVVQKQEGAAIDWLHMPMSFKALKNAESTDGYYIVYSWGSSDFSLRDLDLRGY